MLDQLVIRDDSVTKLEGVIMASMTGESRPRPQRQQHNGCASKLEILHYYLLFSKKMLCIAAPPSQRPSLTAPSTRGRELRDSGLIGQSRRNGVEMVQCQQSNDRGREHHCWCPPAQIRTSPIRASGSYLGCLTAKRSLGQG